MNIGDTVDWLSLLINSVVSIFTMESECLDLRHTVSNVSVVYSCQSNKLIDASEDTFRTVHIRRPLLTIK